MIIPELVVGGTKEEAVSAADTVRVNNFKKEINEKIGGNY
jgi:hypothetical protein